MYRNGRHLGKLRWGFKHWHFQLSLQHSQGLDQIGCAKGFYPINITSFYEVHYWHNYLLDQIWNHNESRAWVERNEEAIILASKGSKFVHVIMLDEQEHLFVLLCLNAKDGMIPNFHIFKGKMMKCNYNIWCESRTTMTMQPKVWIIKFNFTSDYPFRICY